MHIKAASGKANSSELYPSAPPNSVNPEQAALKKQFHLGLHCLLRFFLPHYAQVLTIHVLTIRMIHTYNTHGAVLSLNSATTSDNVKIYIMVTIFGKRDL